MYLYKMSLLKAFTTTLLASMSFIKIIFALFSFLWFCNFCKNKGRKRSITNIISTFFFNFDRIFDKNAEDLQRKNGTLVMKNYYLVDTLLTSDPANVRHILKTNFQNYPKGKSSKNVFDVFGDMLFNADLDEWRSHRKIAHTLFSDHKFLQNNSRINRVVIEDGLLPVLKHVSETGLVFDLQDLFHRLMFDMSNLMATGCSTATLRVGLVRKNEISEALDEAAYVFLLRHIFPEGIWKVQKWLGIGPERSWSKAKQVVNAAAAKIIKMKQEELTKGVEEGLDALAFFLTNKEVKRSKSSLPGNVMRDVVVGLIFAARDTSSAVLSWFFFLLSKNPLVESKLLQELKSQINISQNTCEFLDTQNLNKVAYLHGALCETLRLFPPVPFQSRVSANEDVLPSGHCVNKNARIILCAYAMGRMESVWGKDCLEFKPERWMTEEGKVRAEESSKFMAFSSGPRICPGKELALERMKAVIANIMSNYHVHVVEGQVMNPVSSGILRIKNGLKVQITKRWT